MFGWFNAAKAEEFGVLLAEFFIDKMPPAQQLNESKVASKTQYVLDKLALRVTAFKRENTLNSYQRAKLANTFKWKLKDAGYEKTYVETLVGWLVSRL